MLSCPLFPPSLPSLNLSQHQGLFQWVNSSHQVAKYWSFSFSISPSSEYLRLISFRIDWLGLLAVQRILKSLLQHHNSKRSVLWHSAFFRVQLSHTYMTTGKTIALTRWTFISKEMSLILISCLCLYIFICSCFHEKKKTWLFLHDDVEIWWGTHHISSPLAFSAHG